ncbi:MAG: Gfo/Idh/MocA family oxidoreductase [bacterium]
MKILKVAFLGAGEISDRFIIMSKKLQALQLCGIYSRNINNAKSKAKKYEIKNFYNNYETMLKIEKPNCVVITTPHSLHAKHTIACMKAGAHVLVEKPVATSFADAKKMLVASKKYKKLLMGLPFDHYPNYTRALDFVQEKYIGKITSGHSELSFPGPPRNNWYYDKKIAEGGAILDVGCYALSRIISILGAVKKVSAFVNILLPKRILANGDKIQPTVDDNAVMILEFEGGVFATVKASWCHSFVENHTVIYGRKGTVFINTDNNPLIVKTKAKIAGKKVAFRNLDNCFAPTGFPKFEAEDDIMGRFINWVRTGLQPIYNAEQSLHIMEVMDKAYLSSKTGKTQKITTPFKVWWKKAKGLQQFKEYV